MMVINYIFAWSEKIVDVLAGSLLKLLTLLLKFIGYGFSLLFGQAQPSSTLYGALIFLAFFVTIALTIIAVYLAPWLVAGLFIVLPLMLVALKYTLGWLVLFGLAYIAYLMIKKMTHSVLYLFKVKGTTK